MLTKKLFQWALFFSLIAGTVFIWQSMPLPCGQPLPYSLGQFDARFGISQEDFLKHIAAAEKVWEDADGRELFRYAPDAAFKVNLIFDERQQRTIDARKLEDSLEKAQATQESLKQKQDRVLALYGTEKREYETLLAEFEKRLAEYDADVDKWNKRGGAPEDEYDRLQKEAKSLERMQNDLEAARRSVNALAEQVNRFSKEQVAVIGKYNDELGKYVNRYGSSSEEFDQGDYAGTEINVYQFDDMAHLRLVLAHELGHALGIGHTENPRSVMYRLMQEQDAQVLVLTGEDLAALSAQCRMSRADIFFEKVKLLFEKIQQL